eukprot:Gregarina_sp_Pseudo_9__5735@NODE_837_length_2146_cov_156_884670_g785_i0_p1_GENE_NODE_837_length_2146_cov_156_884670_g785_i0NODE_837_length_2146_cov_156_884670_g785_i0_p1_ORF_typecomplete_len365_score29_22zfCCCH/PF00642_24/0_014zfCCCH/PF00642_24/1_1zfCCCH/PF00642_24/43zfCCCH_3/PF15663_5/2_2zfCCCH_3/PF15663_5/0_011zfCCCH_2/PF14608_6/14zfCCCH_2/PF14608_6/4_4zfCCCH_2/PF14608_6/0_14DUF3363/PF11843_8/0_089_NODE_837_length_2146_cov_156_884670_g785_i09832077
MGENMVNFSPDESLSLFQLSLFRTELCRLKAGTSYCSLGERCQYSHCLSWHRRNPFLFPYRPLLCPNTRFWTESKRMKVKTWCRRGRHCMFAHTKEEQMYHPLVYKTQVCRDWPGCNKPFCPFAHGLSELRDPDSFPLGSMEGPEIVEESIRDLVGEDKIRQDFERKFREREMNEKVLRNLKESIKKKIKSYDVFMFIFRQDASMVVGNVSSDILSTEELYDENFYQPVQSVERRLEILCDGLIAVPLLHLGDQGCGLLPSLSSPLNLVANSGLPTESRSSLGGGSHTVACDKSLGSTTDTFYSSSGKSVIDGSHSPACSDELQSVPQNGNNQDPLLSPSLMDSSILRLDYLLNDQLLSFITKD